MYILCSLIRTQKYCLLHVFYAMGLTDSKGVEIVTHNWQLGLGIVPFIGSQCGDGGYGGCWWRQWHVGVVAVARGSEVAARIWSGGGGWVVRRLVVGSDDGGGVGSGGWRWCEGDGCDGEEDITTPSPKFQVSSPSAPNAPSKTPSTKDTSSSPIDYTPKSPTLLSSPSTNGYLNSLLSPPSRVPPPPPTQVPNSMEITLLLLPITPLDVHHNSPSLSPPIIGHPIP
ncbi:hypothetical protein Tco_1176925 [Tanacetum coccineum]